MSLLSPFAIAAVAIIGVFIWLNISAIAAAVQNIVKHRNEIELKQMLIERGMTAEEIERIIKASSMQSSPSEGTD
jgi:hypothetical protein